MAKTKIRPLGDVLVDMEPLIDECMDHGLQWGDFLALMLAYLTVHRPHDKEVYVEDGSSPTFFYGKAVTKD